MEWGILASIVAVISPLFVVIVTYVKCLVQRGWVQRMGVPNDKKAVFVVVTEEGIRQQAIITRTIDELAQRQLWEKLDKVHRNAIAQVASVVFADIQAKKEAEHQAMLSLLQPL